MYHYCLVRSDLPLGFLAAQLVHAAGESSDRLPRGTYAVVLAAQDEDALVQLSINLTQAGLKHVVIREPDRNNEVTAIGLEPTRDRVAVASVLGNLPLLHSRRRSSDAEHPIRNREVGSSQGLAATMDL